MIASPSAQWNPFPSVTCRPSSRYTVPAARSGAAPYSSIVRANRGDAPETAVLNLSNTTVRGVFPHVYGGRPLPEEVVGSVVAFFSLYFVCHGTLTTALMALELDFLTSASAAVSMLSNVGPGLGDTIGPAGNFAAVPDAAKWLLCLAMLLGRLELFAVLILLMPRFWRG